MKLSDGTKATRPCEHHEHPVSKVELGMVQEKEWEWRGSWMAYLHGFICQTREHAEAILGTQSRRFRCWTAMIALLEWHLSGEINLSKLKVEWIVALPRDRPLLQDRTWHCAACRTFVIRCNLELELAQKAATSKPPMDLITGNALIFYCSNSWK